ncbi:MAG: type 4a pilus biogenesis protein PilO [Candidatus Omnitrophica bacterium]|nr:type 4a pilus biogenesis protein PilO [Candidatus Omnitrophota bacterium]MBU2043827.1 type 4a pilus biogenesis protein PilO [Candidatus Omnitrophota bacterium]MBU2251142.1 type 4a pilus biogenesis protein PilO [Candidatus Omnitrophota bacterium]
MQKINFDKQTVVFLILIVVIIAEVFILLPWSVKRVIDLGKKTAILKKQIETVENDWPRLSQYADVNEKLRREIEINQNRFINSEEASKSLSFISEASKEFNIEIKSFLPGKSQDPLNLSGQKLFYLPINIKAKGQFHNLALFLSFLQNSQYFFEVQQLKIVSDYPYNSLEMILCGIIEKE